MTGGVLLAVHLSVRIMPQYDTEERLHSLTQWDADAISELASVSRLRIWAFAPNSTFGPGILGGLTRLRNLQFLAFNGSELESENLRAVAQFASLRRIDLKNCRFGPDDFAWLCEQWATGACPKLNEIWLEGTTIGDQELRALGKVERGRWIILSNTPISDAGVEYLTGIKKLETLWLQNTRVTETGILKLAVLRKLSIVVLEDKKQSEKVRDQLFQAQMALQKSKKPLGQAQLDDADKRLREFLASMEDWERSAYARAQEIENRHKAARPQSNVLSEAEWSETQQFWSDIRAQKADLAPKFCSRKLLERGAGGTDSYGDPPRYQRAKEWTDVEMPSKKKVIFYGDGTSSIDSKRRYTMVWEDGQWKLDEVQWWSGGWKREIV